MEVVPLMLNIHCESISQILLFDSKDHEIKHFVLFHIFFLDFYL